MPAFAALPVEVLAGGTLASLDRRPLRPYAAEVLACLGDLSRILLAAPGVRSHPDVATFAYWCRAANLARLAKAFESPRQRIGRGLTLHVAPANVPVNFAFSLAFGMLAGNPNIVRVPRAGAPQVAVLCDALTHCFADPDHARIAGMNRVVSYARDDDVTRALSAHCQARVLWGGDQTVAHLRAMPASPRCVDVAFADRFSLCVLDAAAVCAAPEPDLEALADGFCRDSYLMDQNACSSPHLVVWRGTPPDAAAAQARFWPAIARVVSRRYPLAPIHAVDKRTDVCRLAAQVPEIVEAIHHDNAVVRLRLSALPDTIETHRGRHGLFFEFVSDSLDCLAPCVGPRYQTLTTFGIDREQLSHRIVELGLTGIDRIVPVGEALSIGVIWDGLDIVATLSRIVALS